VDYPGTRDIRKAHGLVSKVTEAIKSKLPTWGSYFLYQGIIAWSYTVNDTKKNKLKKQPLESSPKLTPGSNPEHPSSMHKVSLLEESLQT
jgi:hypothetical protein